jgi:serine/threonine protein kinase
VNIAIASESLKPLAAGSRLQEFVIERVIGMGGFGVVYLARDTSLNRTVAIKEYMPNHMVSRTDGLTVTLKSESFAQDFETGKTNFINEARMLARFKHFALVEVFRFWEQNCTAYMATPFYDGGTFKEYISGLTSPLDEAGLKAVLLPILDALQHMHQEKVYHRDISPDNIMILKDGRPILLDLGAARAIEIESAQALTVLVKPGYAPIEQYGGDSNRDQGPWTDIYGVGASAYFALIGKPPPPSASRVMRDAIVKLAELKPSGYSPDFLNAMDAALAVRPDDRPQSVASLKAMFNETRPEKAQESVDAQVAKAQVAKAQVAKAANATPKPKIAPPEASNLNSENVAAKKSRSPTAWIGLAVLAVVGILAWAVLTSQPAPSIPKSVETSKPSIPKTEPVLVDVSTPSAIKMDEAKVVPVAEQNVAASVKNPINEVGPQASAVANEKLSTIPEQAVDKPAVTRLSIKPWGEVFINGENKGVSPPLKVLSLPAGTYAIEVRNGDYPSYKTTVTLKAGEIAKVNHTFVDNVQIKK